MGSAPLRAALPCRSPLPWPDLRDDRIGRIDPGRISAEVRRIGSLRKAIYYVPS